jgi:hypothetical protein
MIRHRLKQLVLLLMLSAPSLSPLHAQSTPAENFRAMKYGFFVHYVWGGEAYTVTVNKDGTKPSGIEDLTKRFDAERFASDMSAMNVEYVLFTAWHANMNTLYPSKVMDKWLPGHSAKRDLIGDMIKACKAKGIPVLLYTHPRDGHDLGPEDMAKTGWHPGQSPNPDFNHWNKDKWNDFVNEVYGELVERYGKDILGLYLDEGSAAADSYRVVDYPRLRKTITAKHPHLIMMQNDYGNLYTADIGNKEIFYNNGFETSNGDAWPSFKIPITIVAGSIFWAAFPEGKMAPLSQSPKVGFNAWVQYSPESMLRYTAFQAGANIDGGGTLWAAGPYPEGGWEVNVFERMKKLGELVKPIEKSIKNTFPSTSYPTKAGVNIASLTWGVATQSTDGKIEYLHVLRPPTNSKTLKLPAPADGKKFAKAILLKGLKPANLRQTAEGLEVSLPVGETWDALDTVFALQVAADSPSQNLALYKTVRATSLVDKKYAMLASDGDRNTAWISAPEDAKPSCFVDFGTAMTFDEIKVVGRIPSGSVLEASDDIHFGKTQTLGASPEVKPSQLQIVKASYGKGETWMDVTEKLQAMVKYGTIQAQLGIAVAGVDPVPNVLKETKVDYILNGKSESITVTEDGMLSLGNDLEWSVKLKSPVKSRFLRLASKNEGSCIVSEIEARASAN